MKRILEIVLAALVAICLIAVVGIYALSEMRLSRTYEVAAADFTVKTTLPAEEAERRARTLMCGGCHHDAGYILLDEPGVGRIVAPNLTRLAPMYSDAELVRLIRHGVKKDRTGAVIMPAGNFANITDDDMAALIAWLRSLKQLPDAVAGGTQWGPLGRVGLALDKIPFEADLVPADLTPAATRPADIGEYAFRTDCSHCHNLDTAKQSEAFLAPALKPLAQSYSAADFKTLLRTGKGIGGRDLGVMTQVSQWDFRYFTDIEIEQIQAYLTRQP
ncbi:MULTISPECIES: c-type cytochrome [Rhizobium]|uniref:c-type cytochrome n=1 Tax=Rhizobium TaxID=379 RepID=UPI000BE96421|nr:MULTISPECIES: c-type cytochrome [Rhizobium]MBY4588869.1 cytochrome c [Rhizobium redzepovicii]MBY4616415.1 cytochrome c [Rhizobium redzepovicii]MDF0663136.1 c-type cytochrome [Rhizobium sp. BC49]MDR9785046.1 c-type cytochrome [Rhizobium redzepovicii]PDS82769.1 cytochrome C [Rhizobium sp. L18]